MDRISEAVLDVTCQGGQEGLSVILRAIFRGQKTVRREMRLKKGVGWKRKPCAGGETSSTLEDSDRGMLKRDKETGLAGALGSLDVLLDLHISFSIWLAA